MESLRCHGSSPFRVVAIHGGPGACGEMAPVAVELSRDGGVIETLHTKPTVQGQINELKRAIDTCGDAPVTLIGHSWGAWLSVMFAVQHPSAVARVVLVSSAPFAPEYAENLAATRLNRMTEPERREFQRLERALEDHEAVGKSDAFAQLARLVARADSYQPIDDPAGLEQVDYRVDVFQSVWPEARRMRQSGQILEYLQRVTCPITAIHGDYDPHPAQGVRNTLEALPIQSQFTLLKECGHTPWREHHAWDEFYRILRRELGG